VTETHEYVDWTMNDTLVDMICDVGVQIFAEAVYEIMITDVKTSLYLSSTNFTRLSIVLRLKKFEDIEWVD